MKVPRPIGQQGKAKLPDNMFDFTREELNYARMIGREDIIDALIPKWYRDQLARKMSINEPTEETIQQ